MLLDSYILLYIISLSVPKAPCFDPCARALTFFFFSLFFNALRVFLFFNLAFIYIYIFSPPFFLIFDPNYQIHKLF